MKKLWNLAFGYFLAAMAGGVFYREFTKYFGFTGETALGYLHVHLLVLGTVLFLFLMEIVNKMLCMFAIRLRNGLGFPRVSFILWDLPLARIQDPGRLRCFLAQKRGEV